MKIKLEENYDEQDYNQIYQTMDTTFSFLRRDDTVKNKFHEMFPRVLCRDYLTDVVVARTLGESEVSGIYGFKFKGELIDSELLMSVKVKNTQAFKRGLRLFRNIEKELGEDIKPIEFHHVHDTDLFVVIADMKWATSALTMSFFTLLLRCINYDTPLYHRYEKLFDYIQNNVGGNDSEYVTTLRESEIDIRFILRNQEEILGDNRAVGFNLGFLDNGSFFTASSTDGLVEDFHNHGGLISFCKNVNFHNVTANSTFSTSYTAGQDWARNYCTLKGFDVKELETFKDLKIGDTLTNVRIEDGSHHPKGIITDIKSEHVYVAVSNIITRCIKGVMLKCDQTESVPVDTTTITTDAEELISFMDSLDIAGPEQVIEEVPNMDSSIFGVLTT